MKHYCLVRSIYDGARTHRKYYIGQTIRMDSESMLRDWTDDPVDINITVMDTMLASTVLSYVKTVTKNNRDTKYALITIDQLHKMTCHVVDLSNL